MTHTVKPSEIYKNDSVTEVHIWKRILQATTGFNIVGFRPVKIGDMYLTQELDVTQSGKIPSQSRMIRFILEPVKPAESDIWE